MRALLLAIPLVLFSSIAFADAIPGDDECPPFQHWSGGHDGQCTCAVSPGRTADGSLVLFGLAAVVALGRRRR
ncbi:MAG: MYXO-CTERM sorting domain-containing protein [Sandaracinaceae bacterium]